MKKYHPMQEVVLADDGVVRFRENRLVCAFYEYASTGRRLDSNAVACMEFSNADRMQFAQLLGYSVSGFGDLNYAEEDVVRKADEKADRLMNVRRETK